MAPGLFLIILHLFYCRISFNTNINKEWVDYITLSGGLFSYTNGAHEIFCLSFVLWSFQVLGKDSMDYGIRSGKSLSLGMPKAPQGNIQGQPKA